MYLQAANQAGDPEPAKQSKFYVSLKYGMGSKAKFHLPHSFTACQLA
jgi:hypothetical protein